MSSQGFKKAPGQGDPMIGPHVHMGPIKKVAVSRLGLPILGTGSADQTAKVGYFYRIFKINQI